MGQCQLQIKLVSETPGNPATIFSERFSTPWGGEDWVMLSKSISVALNRFGNFGTTNGGNFVLFLVRERVHACVRPVFDKCLLSVLCLCLSLSS